MQMRRRFIETIRKELFSNL